MKRFGALACLILYCAASLPLAQGALSLWSRFHRPAAPSTAIAAIAANAIPGPMGEASGHACCCKHKGPVCEMGCCHATDSAGPGESCFRPCGGAPKPAALAFDAGDYLLPSHPGYLFREASGPAPRPGIPSPSRAAAEPPEKVPIA